MRITKQADAVRVAVDACVGHIVYSSVVDAPHPFLRNGMHHENHTFQPPGAYELTGPSAWTFAELVDLAEQTTGKPLKHLDVPTADYVAGLLSGGVPEFLAELFADIQANVRDGALSAVRPDLEKLIGRPPTTIGEAVRVSAS